MPTYTVHAPPPRQGETVSAPERFVFVRDGLHIWALLLTPFWLLRYRLWLAFAIYALFSVVLAVALRLIGVGATVQFLCGLIVSLLVGLEAASIRRRKLAWWGWLTLGFVVGDDLETAEHRFFAEWTKKAAAPAAEAAPPVPPRAPPMPREMPPAIIGLFPEAGMPR
jgi:hypothetical protein